MNTGSVEHQSSIRLNITHRTATGRRKTNQDLPIQAEVVPGRVYLVGVADGMGGYAGGEQAAAIAKEHVQRFAESLRHQVPDGDYKAIAFIRSRMPDLYEQIQNDIQDSADTEPHLSQMGTTLVLACVAGRNFFVANIGDSRAYFLYKDSEGRDVLRRITEDHTVENDAKRAGERLLLETPQARKLARALTRALRPNTPFTPEFWPGASAPSPAFQAAPGDILMLTSDGMYGSVPTEDMEVLLIESPTLDEALERLETLAIEKGSTDNVTTVAVEFGERDPDRKAIRRATPPVRLEEILRDSGQGPQPEPFLTSTMEIPPSVAAALARTLPSTEAAATASPAEDLPLSAPQPSPPAARGSFYKVLLTIGLLCLLAGLIGIGYLLSRPTPKPETKPNAEPAVSSHPTLPITPGATG